MYPLRKSIPSTLVCTGLASAGVVLSPASTVSAVAATSGISTTQTAAQNAFNRMTQAQRIGQLFMVGGPVTGLTSATTGTISVYHVGNLILTGRTTAGAPPARSLTSAADSRSNTTATAGVPLFIATDQEGRSEEHTSELQ